MSVQLKIFEAILNQQFHQEQQIQQAYAEESYSFTEPYVVVNPYLIAPLTTLIMFQTEKPTEVQATIKGKTEAADITLQFPQATEHVLEIVGLYAGMENRVELTIGDGQTNVITVATQTLPEQVLMPTVTTSETTIWENQLVFMVPTNNKFVTAGYDVNGDCRWYTNQKFAYSMKRGQSGRLLVGAPRLLAIPFSSTSLYEISLIGKIYKEYRFPSGFHEDYYEMKDGNILFLGQNLDEGTAGDLICLMDTASGEMLKTWSMKDILPQDLAGSGSQDMHDWFHANSVVYEESTDSITVSGRHQDIIVNMDYQSGKINWMLGDPEGWPVEYVENYFLKPDASVEWAYEPAAVHYLEENVLVCFDSGHYRAKNKENYLAPEKNYSRAVVYRIDAQEKTVSQLWQYGKELGSKFYSTYMGNVSVYGKDYLSIHSGGSAVVAGQAVDMPGIFQQDLDPSTQIYATTIELFNQKEVAKITMPTNTYQAERVAVQDEKDRLQWGKAQIIGAYAETTQFEMDMPFIEAGLIPECYHLSFGYDQERLFLRGDFVNGEMVLLYLESEAEKHCFYIQSTRRPFYTMGMSTFRSGSARPVEWPINLEGFQDCYHLRVVINENIYETGLLLDLRKREF